MTIRDVYAEGNGNVFRVKRCADRGLRKQDSNRRAEQNHLETYMQALGML